MSVEVRQDATVALSLNLHARHVSQFCFDVCVRVCVCVAFFFGSKNYFLLAPDRQSLFRVRGRGSGSGSIGFRGRV